MKTTTTETSIPEEKTTSARIQAYSKSQLAALYLPHIQPASASCLPPFSGPFTFVGVIGYRDN